jgi:hypothetical protein
MSYRFIPPYYMLEEIRRGEGTFLDNGKKVLAFRFQEATSPLLQCFAKQLCRMKKDDQEFG